MKADRSIVFYGFLYLLLTGCGQKEILSASVVASCCCGPQAVRYTVCRID